MFYSLIAVDRRAFLLAIFFPFHGWVLGLAVMVVGFIFEMYSIYTEGPTRERRIIV
jgi:hypothetical protein